MAYRPSARVFVVAISAVATCALVLAVVGAAHHNWGVLLEGVTAAALLFGLTIRTTFAGVRRRRGHGR